MTRMLNRQYALWARIKLPGGGAVYGADIAPRRARRIKRAREKAALRRTLRAEQ